MHKFEQELIDSGKMPIFEIPVINRETKEQEYIICEIGVNNNKLEATRDGITKKELESDKIACTSIDIDLDFSLDSHLEELYSAIIEELCTSELYELSD